MELQRAESAIVIDRMLTSLRSPPSQPYIYRVDDLLRKQNEKAYEPEMLAIGPYHHGKANLQMMEEHKLRYLQLMLQRKNEIVDRYVTAMEALEEKTRLCYAHPTNLNKEEFVRMMLLDGCFIIEYFRKFLNQELRDSNDLIFQVLRMQEILPRDLLLFENQLPFFILRELFNMTQDPNQQDTIFHLACKFFEGVLGSKLPRLPIYTVNHLLGLVHNTMCSSFAEKLSPNRIRDHQGKIEFIKCTTELVEAGIRFEKAIESCPFLDIKFENGIIKVPPFEVDDITELLFRNLIAYEQYHEGNEPLYFTDYTTFLDYLINSPKDAEKLRCSGIIVNLLGDDEAISTLFNKLGNNVVLEPTTFCYLDVFQKVNDHCRIRRHKWIANLSHTYFNNPWSIISLIGAVLLLLLTLIQAICSILQL